MGAIYPAVVKDVRVYGLIVELAPGVTLLLHKSQLSHKMVHTYCRCACTCTCMSLLHFAAKL